MADSIDKILGGIPKGDPGEAVRVVTVRMPASMHAALYEESHARRTSMNRVALAKLLITGEQLDAVIANEAAAGAPPR